MAKQNGGSDNFYKDIENHLKKRAFQDPLFRPVFAKTNKTVKDAVTYILNQVKASGQQGFTDSEIFGMAVHYYDEDDLKPGTSIKCKVIVNHQVQLTPKEIQEALKDAKSNVTTSESEKLTEAALEAKKIELKANLTPEEIAKAKKMAIDEVIEDQRKKMLEKPKLSSIDKLVIDAAKSTNTLF